MTTAYYIPVCVALVLGQAPENDLLRQLTEQGIPAANGGSSTVTLPVPSMPDGLDAAAQRDVMQQVAGPRRQVERLLRDSIVAPFVSQIGAVATGAGEEPMYRVDVWFVAHGQLDSFANQAFHRSLVDFARASSDNPSRFETSLLTAEQLRTRGLQATDTPRYKQHFFHSRVEMFDRVLLRTTRRVDVSIGDESVVVAAVVDPHFTADPQFPNLWRSVVTKPKGRPQQGPPQPYQQSGSYTKITRLQQPPGSLLVEHHQVFAEPEGWFGGKNLLRSKLPLAVQNSVRKLRGRLRSFERDLGARADSDSR